MQHITRKVYCSYTMQSGWSSSASYPKAKPSGISVTPTSFFFHSVVELTQKSTSGPKKNKTRVWFYYIYFIFSAESGSWLHFYGLDGALQL